VTAVDLSVVVCANDVRRWADLRCTIESLQRQSPEPAEIVLVVDHNRELLERARQDLHSVKVVPNLGLRGLGEARNTGVAQASSSVVAFIDDDAVASPGWTAALANAYRDPDVAGAGGPILPVWTKRRPGWFPREFDWVVGCTYRGMPNSSLGLRNLLGCNMSLRRELLTELGGFRVGYGCDETELCIRLHQRWPRMRLVYVPDATVSHHVSPARQTLAYFLSRCYFEGGSKAVVSTLVGAADALSSERSYARRVLPRALARDLADFAGRDWRGLARAAAIIAGFTSASAGYVVGRLSIGRAARRRAWYGHEQLRPAHGALRRSRRASGVFESVPTATLRAEGPGEPEQPSL
jgi:glycosyltransferase involved in cell wall biosynthesis